MRKDPKEQVLQPEQDTAFISLIKHAYVLSGAKDWQLKNSFRLQRGPYTIAAVLDENSDTTALHIKEMVIDLFDPTLPVLSEKVVKPGEQAFLYSLERRPEKGKPAVLCTAARITDIHVSSHEYSFTAKGPLATNNVMRVWLPAKPRHINIEDASTDNSWDKGSHTLLLKFPNNSDGVHVDIQW